MMKALESPASRLAEGWVIVDRSGRRLTLRRLNALDKLRLFKAAGPELAHNEPWLGMAMLATSVSAIDGIPIPPPASEQQVEAIVSRLGEEGISAVAQALESSLELDLPTAVTNAGNLPGTPI